MPKIEVKSLNGKLLDAVKKVFKQNKTLLNNKMDKVITKSIKRIVKKSAKQDEKALKI